MDISDIRELINDTITEIDNLKKDVKNRPDNMQITFNAAEATYIKGKLKSAEKELVKAETSKDKDESQARIIFAQNYLNSANVAMASEVGEYNREIVRIQTIMMKEGTWNRYEAQVKRSHEKFMVVVTGIVELIKRIPSLLV